MQLKIGVVGAGSMGMNHLRVLRDLDDEDVQLVGVAEMHEPILKQAISRFHVAGYTDYREMVEKERPDLVAVVVPTYLHFEANGPLKLCLSRVHHDIIFLVRVMQHFSTLTAYLYRIVTCN